MNSSRTKILFLISDLGCGGAERVSANLANYWAAKGWEITIVTLAPQSQDFYKLHPAVKRIALELTCESSNVLTGLWRNLRRAMALRRVLRKIEPDIAVGVTTTANVLVALSALGLSIRTIGTEHIHPPRVPLSFVWETLRYFTYGLLNAVTALASETENWIKNHTYAKKVLVIPNAVFWSSSVQEPRISPDAFNQSERKLLLAVGRFSEQKGFDWLIEAFSKLANMHPDWDLVILGDGALRATLERQIQKSGLEQRIFLPGRAGNIDEWYESASLFVMSSRFEGFPMTLVEAMAHGLAVVSFDCDTGPRDMIRHELDGLLVPQGNVSELTASLDRLMGDALLRQRFAKQAAEIKERFSMERVAEMWEKLFEEILLEQK